MPVQPLLKNADFSSTLNQDMYDLAEKLFPFPRSLTGNGVRQTLAELKGLLPQMSIVEVPSGTKVFDWEVPPEWNVRDGHILDSSGAKIVDFHTTNLHVMAYSAPVDKTVTLAELNKHLYSLPDQPDVVPFVMSYYKRRWGFGIAHAQRQQLLEGNYRVFIDSTLEPGALTYGELLLPGLERKEILLSTYLCHPSMANDNLSGISVTAYLARWLAQQPERRYSYRILFIPETIGSIVYLSRHLETMKANTIAGFVVTCCGDERAYSFVPTRLGDTLADRVSLHVLKHHGPGFNHYSFLDRGSDERQYCSPGVDLPVVSIMRSKYREYPEYHTSNDDLSVITPAGLGGAFEVLRQCLTALENNTRYQVTVQGEPQLGKRGMFPSVSIKGSTTPVKDMLNLLAYCDGQHDLIDIGNIIQVPVWHLYDIVDKLLATGLLVEVSPGTPGGR